MARRKHTPECRWRCLSDRMVNCWSNTRDALSRPRRRTHGPSLMRAHGPTLKHLSLTGEPIAPTPLTTPWQLSNRPVLSAPLQTDLLECASAQLRLTGSQPCAKVPLGRGARGQYPTPWQSHGLPGSWVSIGTLPASTPQPRARP